MNELGLVRGTVKVLPHDDKWHSYFETERELIIALNNPHIKAIEHVGSTSIPEMPAKPIIDINVGIDNFYNASKLLASLSKIGYEFRLEPRKFQWLFVKMDNNRETHYLKILRYKGVYWNEYEKFKTILTNNMRAFNQYKNLKLELTKNQFIDRKEYTKKKGLLVKKLLNIFGR